VTLTDVVEIGAGQTSSCARLADGTVKCWGDLVSGYASTPTAVAGLSDVVKLHVGGHACAVKKDGTVWCWGANSRGQLGDGSTTNRALPVKVLVSNVAEVVVGARYTCLRINDGTVRCAGDVPSDASQPAGPSFEVVAGLTGVDSLRGGPRGVCAFSSTSVKCWGRNDSGQLGDETTTDHVTPTTAKHFSFGDLALGEDHAITFGKLWAKSLGANDSGQLGIGSTGATSLTPQVVTW
jgi:alpha-tubulin suppressor-like RCC1 family protein